MPDEGRPNDGLRLEPGRLVVFCFLQEGHALPSGGLGFGELRLIEQAVGQPTQAHAVLPGILHAVKLFELRKFPQQRLG